MISNYNDLLAVAAQQAEPQRLLFVFSRTELPEDHSEGEANRFHAGEGGAIVPVMCVDKDLEDLGDFSSLVEESRKTGAQWSIVFVACLSGKGGVSVPDCDAEQGLKNMVSAIQNGMISSFLAFDKAGSPLQFS